MKVVGSVIIERERELTQPLSAEEQFQYAKKAMAGDELANKQARERLVLSMKGLIIKIARDIYNIDFSQLNDVIQESYLMLWQVFSPPNNNSSLQARFNPDFEVKPSTYAAFWIHFAITSYLSQNRLISIPRSISYLVIQFRKQFPDPKRVSNEQIIGFVKKYGARVSWHALKHALSTEQINSLDRKIHDGSQVTFLDVVGEKPEMGKDWQDKKRIIIEKAMEESLNERERQIMRLRYEQGYSQREIGRKFGVSGSRIGQIIRNAERKIKSWILKNYPDLKN